MSKKNNSRIFSTLIRYGSGFPIVICPKCGGGYREKILVNHDLDVEGHLEHCDECGRDWWVSPNYKFRVG